MNVDSLYILSFLLFFLTFTVGKVWDDLIVKSRQKFFSKSKIIRSDSHFDTFLTKFLDMLFAVGIFHENCPNAFVRSDWFDKRVWAFPDKIKVRSVECSHVIHPRDLNSKLKNVLTYPVILPYKRHHSYFWYNPIHRLYRCMCYSLRWFLLQLDARYHAKNRDIQTEKYTSRFDTASLKFSIIFILFRRQLLILTSNRND